MVVGSSCCSWLELDGRRVIEKARGHVSEVQHCAACTRVQGESGFLIEPPPGLRPLRHVLRSWRSCLSVTRDSAGRASAEEWRRVVVDRPHMRTQLGYLGASTISCQCQCVPHDRSRAVRQPVVGASICLFMERLCKARPPHPCEIAGWEDMMRTRWLKQVR
ncbi:hypothetical protein BJV78DRAFT_705996 [Lactifluus subvellereus]|nr:hypothetical protein BJV78DRAFT_705996 [Lactifluus subvellereus]